MSATVSTEPADAAVSVFDASFQSGDAIWEGLRVYNGMVFRLEEHLDRLEHSAHAMRIRSPVAGTGSADALSETLRANDATHDTHVRLMVTRGTRSTSGMDPANAPREGTLVIVPEHKPVDPEPVAQRLRTASVRRPQPQVLDPSIHHANQLNSILARLEVIDEPDVDAALMLDVHGFVAEADTANIFCVVDGRLLHAGADGLPARHHAADRARPRTTYGDRWRGAGADAVRPVPRRGGLPHRDGVRARPGHECRPSRDRDRKTRAGLALACSTPTVPSSRRETSA